MSNALVPLTIEIVRNRIYHTDALTLMRSLPANSVHCVVTSPPYYGLRDYGVDGQTGLEDTPQHYIAHLVELFAAVRRVLRKDGVLWLNLGDSYAANRASQVPPTKWQSLKQGQSSRVPTGLKPKDLIGIPWRVALALQADGWWLRSDIIWHKPNPMPESVADRCTVAHEYVFMLTKSARYWYDANAIKVLTKPESHERAMRAVSDTHKNKRIPGQSPHSMHKQRANGDGYHCPPTRNRRTVWTVPTETKPLKHFAMFPQALIEPMILAGCPVGGIVCDPFMGSGTTALVAQRLERDFTGCDLNAEYIELARKRIEYHGDDKRMVKEQESGVRQMGLL